MKQRSITRQALSILLLAQIAFALALSSVDVLHEWRERIHMLDAQIVGHDDSLLGAIQDAEDPEDNIQLDPDEVRLPPGDRYAVYSAKGTLLGRSAGGTLLPADGPSGLHTVMLDGRRYRVLRRNALRIIDRGEHQGVGLRRPVVMVYASPMSHVFHETFEAVGFSLISIFIVAAVTAPAAMWFLRRAIQPIADLSAAASEVSPASLRFDPPLSAMDVAELQPLSLTLSKLIEELREAFAKEQRFVSDAAHELKTAVAVVRSSIQLLMMKRRREEDYQSGLEQVLIDNDRVERLVGTMLDLARTEQGNVSDVTPIDLAQAVQQACQTMAPVAEARGVNLAVHAQPDACVRLHGDQASTLLTNLLSNSIRHSGSGTTVSVSVERKAASVELRVEDQGSGIRPEALPHVFERFFRDDPSRSRTSGGTGLGLAISRSIVVAAGGQIGIESTPGQGTTVRVLFSND